MKNSSQNKIKFYTFVLYGLATFVCGVAGTVAVEMIHRI